MVTESKKQKKDAIPSLRTGVRQLRDNPQLWWTIFVAIVILLAFWFLASRFITIAQDAQDRLIDIRVGSIQDAYAEFVPEHVDDREFLEKSIFNIVSVNPTIIDFKILKTDEDGENRVVASMNKNEIGSEVNAKYNILLNDARSLPESSFTLREGGTERLFNTVRAYTDDSGEVIGYILTTQTLSEADQKISDSIQNSILIFIVIVVFVMALFLRHARIIDYVSLYKKLQSIDQLKDDFISMASHELRTPLTVIRGYAEYLHEDKKITGESKENVEKIDISAKQLDLLIADMLDVSRIEQGRMKFEMANVDPKDIVMEVVDSLKFNAKDKGLDLSTEIESSSTIYTDSGRLKQVLVNIIGNALKYTKEGEVKVRLFVEKGVLNIRVSDTGIGMDSETQQKLFHKFYRAKSKDMENVRGTGLGLWITKKLVENMNGQISVESIKGVGTHFVISFPVVE